MISILLERFKNKNTMIKTVLFALIFFYFVEDWSFARLITFVALLSGIFLFFNRDILFQKVDTIENKPKNISNHIINDKNNKKYHPNRKAQQSIYLENIVQNCNLDDVKPIYKFTEKLINYTYHMKDMINKDDPSYAKLIDELIDLTKEYVKQINLLLKHTNTSNYPHLLYGKVKDCQKEISIQMQSIHFKVGVDQYAELEMIIDDYETQTEKITEKLIDHINDTFTKSPNAYISPVPQQGEPRAYDDELDINSHIY
jgi:hypothetical protein